MKKPKRSRTCPVCGKQGSVTLHTCPYHVAVYRDRDVICNCCKSCVQDCEDSIADADGVLHV